MNMKWVAASVFALSSFGIVACSHAPLQDGFNEANSNNITVQRINPHAGEGDVPVATLEGAKAERLLQRYRSDSGKSDNTSIVSGVTSK